MNFSIMACAVGSLVVIISPDDAIQGAEQWRVGTPIVTYWAGPTMTDNTAQQMSEGGWNLVWCTEKELDVAERHGVRAQLHDGLLAPDSLEDSAHRSQLDALIERVKRHKALYSYFITDEPNATNFSALGKLVSYLREKDPEHLAYINLFPTYASNEQLGNSGEKVPAYQAHLRSFLKKVNPSLISYDHYQFTAKGDSPDYFLNLELIRQAAIQSRLPFLNIVQAATWTPSMRIPTPDEMRFLIYTSLAYGAQGISYYVYCCQGHTGGIANPDGSPTPLYDALKLLNRDFVAIARELQPLKSLGVFHAGMLPPGGEPIPDKVVFVFDPPLTTREYTPPRPLQGALIGVFGKASKRPRPTYALVANLDYKSEQTLGVRATRELEIFNASTHEWQRCKQRWVEIRLSPGAGKLVRLRR